jgi:hypothetical protein
MPGATSMTDEGRGAAFRRARSFRLTMERRPARRIGRDARASKGQGATTAVYRTERRQGRRTLNGWSCDELPVAGTSPCA